MTTKNKESIEPDLIVFVHGLKERDDRGTLALLRGALADSEEKQIRAWRILARFGGIPREDPHKANVVRTVAGLMAMPNLNDVRSGTAFGYALLQLLGEEERKSLSKAVQPGPISCRMQHLLAASRSEVCERVRQLGRRLDRKAGTVDFAQLYHDLLYWGDRAKARWAAAFWGTESEDATFINEKETVE